MVGELLPRAGGSDIVGVGVVGVDVTERVRGERFRSVVMGEVADGVFVQDGDGLLTYMNQAASNMLGWSESQLRGRRMHDVIHFRKLDGTPISADERPLLTQGTQARVVRTVGESFTRKDGTIFPVAYSAVPLAIGSRSDGVAVVFRDIGRSDTHSKMIRVMVVEGGLKISELFAAVLSAEEGVDVIAVLPTSAAAIDLARHLTPDVVIVGDLTDLDGVAAVTIIKLNIPTASVILMMEHYDQSVAVAAIAAGCTAVLDKDRAWVELLSTVRAAYHGETTISQAELGGVLAELPRTPTRARRPEELTPREIEVLTCLMEGLSNRLVGERLGVSANTIRNHVQRILCKLNAHSKLEAVVIAGREGLLGGNH
jgi:PAS domain S-box-containing protein